MTISHLNRRSFLEGTLAAGIAWPWVSSQAAQSPNEKVRIAAVGVGGKGWTDLTSAAKFADVVAFCDVETGQIKRRGGYGSAAETWPKARRYSDWRVLLEKEHKNLDGITVSTPDHMHAPITMTALKLGLATYTQKPLTRTIHEARALALAAKEAKVSTQMGNQGHSGTGYRALVHWIQSGIIGKVKTAHTWSNRPIWPQGINRPAGSDPVPESLDWDLWLGVAKDRPYKKDTYHPFKWRGWYDFGAGALGDMGCHIIDPVFWSLELKAPLSVSYEGPKPFAETFPREEKLVYRFPGTKHTIGDAFEMTWRDGGLLPEAAGSHLPKDFELPKNGVLMIGEQGRLLCPHGGRPELFPKEQFRDVKLPELEPMDHYRVWIDGIKTGRAPNSSFEYAGPLTETVLLGVVASRVGEASLQWNAGELKFANSDQANRYVKEDYRKGWEVEGLS
jgi:predicted dehydrogenase